MPDPNKRKPRLTPRQQADASKTPKVRKDPKFTGTQRYGREFMCKLKHNGLTNDKLGESKYQSKPDATGTYGKNAVFKGKGHFPGKSEGYLGGMFNRHTVRQPTAANLTRGN